MPIKFSLLDHGAGGHYRFTGLVTGNELIEVNTSLYASEKRLKKLKYAIVDLTHMESLDLAFVDLKKIEEMDRLAAQVNPSLVVAIIVEKELPLNISRAWDVRTHDILWAKKIFGSKDEACVWVREKVKEKFGEGITVTT